MQNVEKNFYKTISAESNQKDEYSIDNGKHFQIKEVGGNAVHHIDVKVSIYFGDDIIFATHGDSGPLRKDNKVITGDGSTKLTIELTNDTAQSETIGAYYKGILLD